MFACVSLILLYFASPLWLLYRPSFAPRVFRRRALNVATLERLSENTVRFDSYYIFLVIINWFIFPVEVISKCFVSSSSTSNALLFSVFFFFFFRVLISPVTTHVFWEHFMLSWSTTFECHAIDFLFCRISPCLAQAEPVFVFGESPIRCKHNVSRTLGAQLLNDHPNFVYLFYLQGAHSFNCWPTMF